MNLKLALIVSLLSLGELHQSQKEDSQARECYEKAYAIAKEINLTFGMSAASSMIEGLSKPDMRYFVEEQ